MSKKGKNINNNESFKVSIKSTSRFECEFLGYSIYVFKRANRYFVSLVISERNDVVYANSNQFADFDEAIADAVRTIFN
jgi:hypothetical protein